VIPTEHKTLHQKGIGKRLGISGISETSFTIATIQAREERAVHDLYKRGNMIAKLRIWAQGNRLFLALGFVVLVIAFVALRINIRFWGLDTRGSDTYYSWVEGSRIRDGINPYERILHGNMRENRKYATYFPLFYEASALTQLAGYRQYKSWISFYRYIFLACNLAIGFVLYTLTFSKRTWAFSLFAVLFWYFNRWTLTASKIVALDFIPILLMVVSLAIFERHRKTSLLLLSLSLAIKQIAIFIVPLYLIWEYQQSRSLKNVITASFWIASVPLITSVPFLAWNAEGFIKSIAFSGTRDATTNFKWVSIDAVANLDGLLARIPILAMLVGTYFLSWQKTIGPFAAAMLVMMIFIGFNPVLYVQYFAWLIPLLPLAVSEWVIKTRESDEIQGNIEKNQTEMGSV
jgi:hypothetical protein